MAFQEPETVMLEGVRLTYMNFAGEKDQFNVAGDRNFAVVLTPELAEQLSANKWNVKTRPAQEEGESDFYFLPVKVAFENRPPRITLLTNGTKTRTMLNEATVAVLDKLEFTNIDVMIRAYDWDVNGKQGRKAYLQTGFFTVYEDPLERKYAAMFEAEDDHGE